MPARRPVASPADLARLRRPPPPPQPPQQPPRPRGRRLAEIEKERARSHLRSLVADPATDFAALDGEEFFAALRCACQDGTVNPALIDEAGRRIDAGTVASRDLHQVLCVAGDDDGWGTVRRGAMAAVARRPHHAVEVVHLEVQRLGVAPMVVAESAGAGSFTARASLERHGETVEGQPCADTSKKRASQRAVVSLLEALVGVAAPATAGADAVTPLPATPAATTPPVPAPAVPARGAQAPGAAGPALAPADLEAWLDHVAGQPEPDRELAGQLAAARLTPRALYLLLFEAQGPGWQLSRAAAWEQLVATASQAPGVLSMYTQSRSWPPAAFVESGIATAQREEHAPAGPANHNSAFGYVDAPGGPVVGEPAVAGGIRGARAAAALALVRDLAPPVHVGGEAAGAAPEGNPVGVLNERAQTGAVAELTYTDEASGPAHLPVFTCTVSCRYGMHRYAGTAEGASRSAAKAAAAADLLEQLRGAERGRLANLDRARREQARSPEGIFTRLLRAGYPLHFTGWSFQVGGDLPGPLRGYELPVASALPVLAVVEDPVHPSVRGWAGATRAALEAVAARRVYPAVDADGHDGWRLAPATRPALDTGPALDAARPGVGEFFDAVAEALLRPPGARLVVGELPYAGTPRRLTPEAAEWGDRAADAAEATTAAPLVIRLAPPEGDGQPLRGWLHVAGAGAGPQPHGDATGGWVPAPAEQRLVRRGCRLWPPLERLWRHGTVGGAEAAQLLGPVGERLAELGIAVEWPADLVATSGLDRRVVVAPRGGGAAAGSSLAGVADLTWQLWLDGEPLTEEETAAAADAVSGAIRLRGRWLLVDAETRRLARERHAGHLTGAQGLAAALTGQVAIGGHEVACTAAGQLAEVVATLRAAGSGASAGADEQLAQPGGLQATLRQYQRVAVHWLLRTTAAGFGALLADDMGLGKTLTVIAYRLSRANDGATLVVCPASLVVNWEREFSRFAPGVTVRRHHGAGRSLAGLRPGEVVVTTYGTLLRDAEALAGVPWDLVVADEAQQIKNHRSRAARALRLLHPAARVAVTGTPVENSVAELWSILDWTNPGLFGSLTAFRDRFGRAAEREVAGAGADREAARRLGRLVAPFVMRRRKSDPDVAPELPDKVVNDRYVELTREQAALYRAVTAEIMGRIAASDGPGRRGQVLRLLQALRQICNSPAHYLRESPDGWDAAGQAARSGKLQVLEELMEAVLLTDDAALIFTGYVSMGHLIRAHLAACGYRVDFLHGGVPAAARQEAVDRFQGGDGDALILSVRAAGTGLNLTRAGHVIHFDRPWNPAVEDQATDRAHRIGQHRLVEVHHLIAEGTVEDRIAGLLARKRELTEAILPGEAMALAELSDSELSALVSLGGEPGAGGAP